MITKIKSILLLLAVVFVASCSTTKNTDNTKPAKGMSSADAYKMKVINNKPATQSFSAKMHVDLSMGDKDVSLSGSLKMKRGNVIQISLTFPIIGEIGRMEFTPENVLIVDRINTRYVRTSYDKIDFLRSSNLDFNVLESVFWNEIFYPGADVKTKISDFTMASAGSHTLLSLTTAPKLDYSFLTITESALLDRTTVSSKNTKDDSALTCIYSNFVKFDNGKFPSGIKLTFVGDKQEFGLNISLSSMSTASDWNTRTELSAKYKQIDAESLLRNLIP